MQGTMPRYEGRAEPVGIVSLVSEHGHGVRDGIEDLGSALVVAHLAFAEQREQRPAPAIADDLELRVEAAFGSSDTWEQPLLSRLAAVRYALRWVASIISRSDLPPLGASSAKMRCHQLR